MDPLISKLNQRVAEKIANTPVSPNQTQGPKSFANVLESKQSDLALKKMTESFLDDGGSAPKVQSADFAQINRVDFNVEKNTNFDPKQKLMDLFSGLNEDMVSLDSSIEVLADPNVKLNRRQLLAYQAGIGHMTVNTELFSKLAQSVSQNLNTLLNTNVG